MERKTVAVLRDDVRRGGVLVAAGPLPCHDEHGNGMEVFPEAACFEVASGGDAALALEDLDAVTVYFVLRCKGGVELDRQSAAIQRSEVSGVDLQRYVR